MSSYPHAYIDYLVHFHGDRDWFECHEILEEYWKEQGMKDQVWVTLIQIAVGLYHERRGNVRGAEKMLGSALKGMQLTEMLRLGLDGDQLKKSIDQRIENIHSLRPFEDFNLPIMNQDLLDRCIKECTERNMVWQGKSNLEDEQLIHKHTLRDRSEVLKEREEKLKRNSYKQQ